MFNSSDASKKGGGSGGEWSSFFQKALNTVESSLDKVLEMQQGTSSTANPKVNPSDKNSISQSMISSKEADVIPKPSEDEKKVRANVINDDNDDDPATKTSLSSMTRALKERESQISVLVRENSRLQTELVNAKQNNYSDEMEKAHLKKIEDQASQIQDLLREGENLSKLHLKYTTIIKKQKAKEEEITKELEKLKKVSQDSGKIIIEKDSTIEVLNTRLKQLEESLPNMQALNDSQAKQISKITSELVALTNEKEKLAANLEKSDIELKEQKRITLEVVGNGASEKYEKALKEKEMLQSQLETMKGEFALKDSNYCMVIETLRMSISKLEQEKASMEDQLRFELQELQNNLMSAQHLSLDIDLKVQEATRPILLELQDLKEKYSNEKHLWEQKEISHLKKVSDLERERSKAFEGEKIAVEKLDFLALKVESLETQINVGKAATSLDNESKLMSKRLDDLTKEKNELLNQIDLLKSENMKLCEISHFQKMQSLEEELEAERDKCTRIESELRKELESLKQSLALESARETNAPVNPIIPPSSRSLDYPSYPSTFKSINPLSMEYELKMAIEAKEEMANALVKANQELEKLRLNTESFDPLKERYEACLVLLGEKSELVEELKADISEMKEAYREQLEGLIARVNSQT